MKNHWLNKNDYEVTVFSSTGIRTYTTNINEPIFAKQGEWIMTKIGTPLRFAPEQIIHFTLGEDRKTFNAEGK